MSNISWTDVDKTASITYIQFAELQLYLICVHFQQIELVYTV